MKKNDIWSLRYNALPPEWTSSLNISEISYFFSGSCVWYLEFQMPFLFITLSCGTLQEGHVIADSYINYCWLGSKRLTSIVVNGTSLGICFVFLKSQNLLVCLKKSSSSPIIFFHILYMKGKEHHLLYLLCIVQWCKA